MIEKILFSWLFQKKFHGFSSLDDYFVIHQKLFATSEILTVSELAGHGFFIGEAELQTKREEFSFLLSRGVQFVFPGHEFYPIEFKYLSEPPFLVSYLGSPVWLTRQGLAVVGSREAEPCSLQWMNEYLSQLLENRSIYLVSGGARGVDQKAHALCLLKEKPTIALIPAGLGQIYPSQFKDWVEPIIAAGGAVMSEYDYNSPMKKHYFHARNRLISALGVCTLIIQAERRSGSLITGRQAIEQGKPVLVLPSHPLLVRFHGGLDLLMEGATPVRDAHDLEIILDSEFLGQGSFYPPVVGQGKPTNYS